MLQGINSTNTNTQFATSKQENILQTIKTQAINFKDTFEKSDETTKLKTNSALAGSTILWTLLTLLGAHGKKVAQNTNTNNNQTIRKQRGILKWIGAGLSLVSSATILALNTKLSKNQENTNAQNKTDIKTEQETPGNEYDTIIKTEQENINTQGKTSQSIN